MRQKKYNEYGVKLDKNGYAPSLFVHEAFRCYHCHASETPPGMKSTAEAAARPARRWASGLTFAPPATPPFIQAATCKTTTTNKANCLQKPITIGITTTFAAASILTTWRTNLC